MTKREIVIMVLMGIGELAAAVAAIWMVVRIHAIGILL
jgi:hypothetical protein